MRQKTSSQSNWAVLLQQSIQSMEVRPEGDGWMTIDELSKSVRLGIRTLGPKLKHWVACGSAERFRGKVNINGSVRVQYWYRVK